jgi:hypothetical protein
VRVHEMDLLLHRAVVRCKGAAWGLCLGVFEGIS